MRLAVGIVFVGRVLARTNAARNALANPEIFKAVNACIHCENAAKILWA